MTNNIPEEAQQLFDSYVQQYNNPPKRDGFDNENDYDNSRIDHHIDKHNTRARLKAIGYDAQFVIFEDGLHKFDLVKL